MIFLKGFNKNECFEMSFLWTSTLYYKKKWQNHFSTKMICDFSPTVSPPHTTRRLHPLLLQPSKKSLESPVWGYSAPSCHSWGCAGRTGLPGALGYLWRASWISSPGSGRAPADTESWKKSKNNNTGHVRGPVWRHLGVFESPGFCDGWINFSKYKKTLIIPPFNCKFLF